MNGGHDGTKMEPTADELAGTTALTGSDQRLALLLAAAMFV